MKRTTEQLNQQRRTAQLVRACYDRYVPETRATAEQLYGLCKLTWVTGQGSADNTRCVVAPALSFIMGSLVEASSIDQLPPLLTNVGAPDEIVRLTDKPVGIVNFYNPFRNIALSWIRDNLREIRQMVRIAATASSDAAARRSYAILEACPTITRPVGGALPSENLLSPMLACLDPRRRSPIINGRTAKWKLQPLGLRCKTLTEQFDGLVNLIGQTGVRDAFDLDTLGEKEFAALIGQPKRRNVARSSQSTRDRGMRERADSDVEFFRKAAPVQMRRVHRTMEKALRSYCKVQGWAIEEGTSPNCMFDALIPEYDGNRHLLVEIKTDSAQPTSRLALGQLLDYRRNLSERARIDLAVLFPSKPRSRAKALLDDVGVTALWFGEQMKKINGLPPNKSLQPTPRSARGG